MANCMFYWRATCLQSWRWQVDFRWGEQNQHQQQWNRLQNSSNSQSLEYTMSPSGDQLELLLLCKWVPAIKQSSLNHPHPTLQSFTIHDQVLSWCLGQDPEYAGLDWGNNGCSSLKCNKNIKKSNKLNLSSSLVGYDNDDWGRHLDVRNEEAQWSPFCKKTQPLGGWFCCCKSWPDTSILQVQVGLLGPPSRPMLEHIRAFLKVLGCLNSVISATGESLLNRWNYRQSAPMAILGV